MEFDLPEAQQELADRLGIEKKTDVADILMRFYQCTKREPRFISTYRENDGSIHSRPPRKLKSRFKINNTANQI